MLRNNHFLIFFLAICIPFSTSGFFYEHISKGYCTSVHVLKVDPKEHVIMPVKAFGRETVASLAKRYGAIAAINGGFWKLNGDPAGILKINQRWYGTPTKPRGAIGWTLDSQKVLIDRVLTSHHLDDCDDDGTIEVIPVSAPPHTAPEEWKEMRHIIGGTPVLINNETIVKDYTPEQTLKSFLVNRHPRTAVGITNNGEWVFVVVDSRFYGFFGGMTIKELAALMNELGCTKALNLDGGSSSTMVVEGAVVNESYGSIKENSKRITAVSDAILIFPASSS